MRYFSVTACVVVFFTGICVAGCTTVPPKPEETIPDDWIERQVVEVQSMLDRMVKSGISGNDLDELLRARSRDTAVGKYIPNVTAHRHYQLDSFIAAWVIYDVWSGEINHYGVYRSRAWLKHGEGLRAIYSSDGRWYTTRATSGFEPFTED